MCVCVCVCADNVLLIAAVICCTVLRVVCAVDVVYDDGVDCINVRI